jgi:hypothetical protein
LLAGPLPKPAKVFYMSFSAFAGSGKGFFIELLSPTIAEGGIYF